MKVVCKMGSLMHVRFGEYCEILGTGETEESDMRVIGVPVYVSGLEKLMRRQNGVAPAVKHGKQKQRQYRPEVRAQRRVRYHWQG